MCMLEKKEISALKDLMVKLERCCKNAYVYNNHIFNVESEKQIKYVGEQMLFLVDRKVEEELLRNICKDNFCYISDITALKELLSEAIKEKRTELDMNVIYPFFEVIEEEYVKTIYDKTMRYFLSISNWESFDKFKDEMENLFENNDYAKINDENGEYPSITLTKSHLPNVTIKSLDRVSKSIHRLENGLYEFDMKMELDMMRSFISLFYLEY